MVNPELKLVIFQLNFGVIDKTFISTLEATATPEKTRMKSKYLLFEFDGTSVKLKPTNGSKDNVSHAEFWSSAGLAERKNTVGRYLDPDTRRSQ
jgi:hypothetical protein